MNVPFLSKQTISKKATELIDGFQAMAGYEVKPPIPVEDIIERYLGLRLLYNDLTRVFRTVALYCRRHVRSRRVSECFQTCHDYSVTGSRSIGKQDQKEDGLE